MGDMPDLGAHLQAAYNELKDCDAAQKHVIIISDGDPQPPTKQLLNQFKQKGITCTGVAVFPHSANDVQSLRWVAQLTGGRFYNVKAPSKLPQIFIKEAQVVRRALINEETFTPQIVYSLSEITKGTTALPALDGYVLTGPREGLSQLILSNFRSDPILATCQSGLGRCVAFTSSIDSRWGSKWLSWNGRQRFWEQVIRWAGKSSLSKSTECEIFTDVQGRKVTIHVEAADSEGNFMQLGHIDGQVIAPNASTSSLEFSQVGPGQYQGSFQVPASGSYLVNVRYRKVGEPDKTHLLQSPVTIPFAPEFRDLSDNSSLLEQISAISGGRILPAPWEDLPETESNNDPATTNLFDYNGVKFPQTQLPIHKPLMIIWLAVFLLDVAVRRIVVDFKSIVNRMKKVIKRRGGADKTDKTIEQLKRTRKKTLDRFSQRQEQQIASRRYQADEQHAGALPTNKTPSMPATAQPETNEKPQEQKPKATEHAEHIQQLLKAKRKATDRQQDNDTDNQNNISGDK